MITRAMGKPGALVLDVGSNRVGCTLGGDVAVASLAPVPSASTPAPVGVGAISVAMLRNTMLQSFERSSAISS